MAQVVIRPQQVAVLRRAVILTLTSLLVLLLAGFQNQIALTVVPAVAGVAGLTVDELNLRRTSQGRPPIAHGWCAVMIGTAVFVAVELVMTAT